MTALFRDAVSMRLMILVEEKLTALQREFYQDTAKREMFASAIHHIKLLLEHEGELNPSPQQPLQPDYNRGTQATGNDYRSKSESEYRSQSSSEYRDNDYSRNRQQNFARDRKPESID